MCRRYQDSGDPTADAIEAEARKRKAFFRGVSRCAPYFGSLTGGYIEKGVIYLLIAFLLGLVLWWLRRQKKSGK